MTGCRLFCDTYHFNREFDQIEIWLCAPLLNMIIMRVKGPTTVKNKSYARLSE